MTELNSEPIDIFKLKRKLNRLVSQQEKIDKEHRGNERDFTYHAGFRLGYLEGKIAAIEDVLGEIEQTEAQERASSEEPKEG